MPEIAGRERAREVAAERLPEIITAARAFGADRAIDKFAEALQSEYERGKRESAERLLQLISGGIGLMNHSEQQQVVSRWWRAVLPELEPDDKGRL